MFQMECPAGCGKVLESEEKSGILRVYDVHIHEAHQASPAQWSEAYERIQEGKERAKKASAAQSAGKS